MHSFFCITSHFLHKKNQNIFLKENNLPHDKESDRKANEKSIGGIIVLS